MSKAEVFPLPLECSCLWSRPAPWEARGVSEAAIAHEAVWERAGRNFPHFSLELHLLWGSCFCSLPGLYCSHRGSGLIPTPLLHTLNLACRLPSLTSILPSQGNLSLLLPESTVHLQYLLCLSTQKKNHLTTMVARIHKVVRKQGGDWILERRVKW